VLNRLEIQILQVRKAVEEREKGMLQKQLKKCNTRFRGLLDVVQGLTAFVKHHAQSD
jgi:hypothetical protein